MVIMKTLFLFTTLATAVCGKGDVPLDSWTLYNSSITCNTSCEYDFFVQKHNSGEKFHCSLRTEGPPNPSSLPVDEPCHEDPLMAVTLSWGLDLSIIFCIADIHENTIAFYGLEPWEIYNGTTAPNKTEWAWKIGQIPVLSTELPSSPTP
ncbi:hypothetical protein F4781DRAFT_437067 [Annulohypoxylon bovei var. microspora]|nr:hypothetical protein F4781DRAFT_437067 [Annulohypoxylon bovei var. microspora]